MSRSGLLRFRLRRLFQVLAVCGSAFGVVHWAGTAIFVGAFWGAMLGGLGVFFVVAFQDPLGRIEVSEKYEAIGLLAGLSIGGFTGLLLQPSTEATEAKGLSLIVCIVILLGLWVAAAPFWKRSP